MNSKNEIVEVSTSGRCDRILRNSLISGKEWLSRASWDWLFQEKKITKAGKFLRPGDTVSAGDKIELHLPGPLNGVLPAATPAELVASGNDWIFVSKPAGVPTLPLLPWENFCFTNQVASLVIQKRILTQEAYSALATPPILEGGLVQRLDNETSGGILVALSKLKKAEFREAIGKGLMKKTYLAVVHGSPKVGKFKFWLEEEVAHKKMRALLVKNDSALPVEVEIELIERKEERSFVRVTTYQGSRHIVRATLACLNAPICGDSLYGDGKPILDSYPFHLLHAETIQLSGLINNVLRAPLPVGFISSLSEAGFAVDDF